MDAPEPEPDDPALGDLTKRLRRHVSLLLKQLIVEGEPDSPRIVGVGVSGGGDSMALLEIVAAERRRFRWFPLAIHVHHGIRGADADEDAALVAARCKALEFAHVECRIAPPASTATPSEDDLRRARLEAYARALKEAGGIAHHVILAHSLDDQAETVLHRLFRGTGPDGIGAMAELQPIGRLTLVRPLLGVRRAELRDFLRENGVPWREDATNAEPVALRNRLRLDLMPLVEREFGPSGVAHVGEFAARLRTDGEFFVAVVDEILATEPDYPTWIRWGRFQNFHPSILSRLARRWLRDLLVERGPSTSNHEVTAHHVERFLSFAITAQPGDAIDSVGGLVLRCVRGGRFTTELPGQPLRVDDMGAAK